MNFNGKVEFQTTDKSTTVVTVDPDARKVEIAGAVVLGTKGTIGSLGVCGNDGQQKIRLFGELASCQLGGNGLDGLLTLHPAKGKNSDPASKARIYLNAINSTVNVGGNGSYGKLFLYDGENEGVISLDAQSGDIKIGGSGLSGDLMLFNAFTKSPHPAEEARIHLSADNATIRVGNKNTDGKLLVRNKSGQSVVQIDGASGDILLENADCAEEFDVDDPAVEPGSVLVLSNEPGRLRVSDAPYDTRVAGILSGAGNYRPAIVLDRKPGREGRRPIALVGKVWCKVEAHSAPIGVGCLLTTSSLPGHAMAATDRERAFGAIIGKALAPLRAGVGMMPVLVALQ